MNQTLDVVEYSEDEYLDGGELQDDASASSSGTIDLSTAAASEATTRYDDIKVPRKRKAVVTASQTSRTSLPALDGPVLPVRSGLDRQRKLSRKSPRESGRRWMVEALAQGDDSTNEDDCKMRLVVIYASARARASHKSFHAIQCDTEIFAHARSGELRLPNYAVEGSKGAGRKQTTNDCIIPTTRKARSRSRREKKDVVAGFVWTYLDKHPGIAVIFSGVGARERHPSIQKEVIKHATQPFVTKERHNCLQAALVNAVFALNGREVAEKVSELALEDKSFWRNMRPIGALLCRAPTSTTGCSVVRDPALNVELQAQERHCGFKKIASRTDGVFFVRIRDECRVDHAGMVDANVGIIVDSEDTEVLLLSARNLHRCGGPSTRKLRIQEVRVAERINSKRKRGRTDSDAIIDVDALPTAKTVDKC